MPSRAAKLITLMSGASDTTGPACAITSASSGIIAGAFSVTATFTNPETGLPEAVTGFTLGDITCSANAGASNLANPSTGVYTATVTPTAAGTVTVDVAAGVCTDAARNNNTAATQFSIVSMAGAVRGWDLSDITTLYQTNDTSTPVTTDGQMIGYVADKSGSGGQVTQATEGNRWIYKVNIKNGLSAGLVGLDDFLSISSLTLTNFTAYLITTLRRDRPLIGGNTEYANRIAPESAGNDSLLTRFPSDPVSFSISAFTTATFHLVSLTRAAGSLNLYLDGAASASNPQASANNWVPTQLGASGGIGLNGYFCEGWLFPTAHSDAVRQAIQTALSTKWAVP